MAKNYEEMILSQKSFYNKNNNYELGRNLNIYYSIPEKGVNEETGILLFIAGFGGNANSNVYKKMREQFADDYNLVTVQCDYFGTEFMQGLSEVKFPKISKEQLKNIFLDSEIDRIYLNGDFNPSEFMKYAIKYNINLSVDADLSHENIDNFNDMSFMQGIDNITAIIYIASLIYNQGKTFNANRIIVFGHSHGAYSSHLCNLLAPGLINLLVDNSSWIYPQYLKLNNNRMLISYYGEMKVDTTYKYLAKDIIKDFEIRDLNKLYKDFKNKCKIVCFQGVTDNLVDFSEKRKLCNSIDNCDYNQIDQSKVDGKVFKSTNHGLDADFLELFKMVMNNPKYNNFKKSDEIEIPDKVKFKSSKYTYTVDYENVIPIIKVD